MNFSQSPQDLSSEIHYCRAPLKARSSFKTWMETESSSWFAFSDSLQRTCHPPLITLLCIGFVVTKRILLKLPWHNLCIPRIRLDKTEGNIILCSYSFEGKMAKICLSGGKTHIWIKLPWNSLVMQFSLLKEILACLIIFWHHVHENQTHRYGRTSARPLRIQKKLSVTMITITITKLRFPHFLEELQISHHNARKTSS